MLGIAIGIIGFGIILGLIVVDEIYWERNERNR